ncbi:hypothetical protein JR316_0012781 [Psilocybe cubensis]|uniref:Uncharacterized protein n=1 Tax=Psilocybe cubensis TaxID=181762 RepID=A0ACB8GFF9_PSICU|nr:hypothetical protein JR316_0012781 [Psilocybe cubensis]KAH9474323.1 hypothetical protein JR316_0012781 [Psilocybe cubensis]
MSSSSESCSLSDSSYLSYLQAIIDYGESRLRNALCEIHTKPLKHQKGLQLLLRKELVRIQIFQGYSTTIGHVVDVPCFLRTLAKSPFGRVSPSDLPISFDIKFMQSLYSGLSNKAISRTVDSYKQAWWKDSEVLGGQATGKAIGDWSVEECLRYHCEQLHILVGPDMSSIIKPNHGMQNWSFGSDPAVVSEWISVVACAEKDNLLVVGHRGDRTEQPATPTRVLSSSPAANANQKVTGRPRYHAKDWWPDVNSNMSVSSQESPSPHKANTFNVSRTELPTSSSPVDAQYHISPNDNQVGEEQSHASQKRREYKNVLLHTQFEEDHPLYASPSTLTHLNNPTPNASPSTRTHIGKSAPTAFPFRDNLAALYNSLKSGGNSALHSDGDMFPSDDDGPLLHPGSQQNSHYASNHLHRPAFEDNLALMYSDLTPSANDIASQNEDKLAALFCDLSPAFPNNPDRSAVNGIASQKEDTLAALFCDLPPDLPNDPDHSDDPSVYSAKISSPYHDESMSDSGPVTSNSLLSCEDKLGALYSQISDCDVRHTSGCRIQSVSVGSTELNASPTTRTSYINVEAAQERMHPPLDTPGALIQDDLAFITAPGINTLAM